MAKRARAKTVEVNASHVAYMSYPKETAKLDRGGCHLRTRQWVAIPSQPLISADSVRVGGDSRWI